MEGMTGRGTAAGAGRRTRRTARAAVGVALVLAATAGCSEAVDTASRVRDCAALASDVAATGVGTAPSLAQAEEAVRRLDERIATLGDGEVKAAATTLRDRLADLVTAARTGDAAGLSSAAAAARAAAEQAARTCGLPVEQFLGPARG